LAIAFDIDGWETIRNTYNRWWNHALDRPIIPITLTGFDPGRPMPDAPLLSQKTCADLTIPVDALVDRLDWELSTQRYLGDAFPWINMHTFGPGVLAAMLGAKLDNSTGGVWFHPPADIPITDLHLEYDPDNIWLCRIRDLCATMMKRWQGQVLVAMTDLGGVMDVLSTFRPSEQLLLDLYDHPDHVQRVVWEIHEAWHRVFEDLNSVLQPINPGYTAWCGIYSDQPYYMLQCDFSYMISPQMFETFAKPELAASTRRLSRSFYHLDGRGQLPHLPALLSIDTLDGVQWIPGDGAPNAAHWPEVYRAIHASGKLIQVTYGRLDELEIVMQQLGTNGGNIQLQGFRAPAQEETTLRRRLERFGIG